MRRFGLSEAGLTDQVVQGSKATASGSAQWGQQADSIPQQVLWGHPFHLGSFGRGNDRMPEEGAGPGV